ncbi:unnamed protein product [Protopolystoma xenopodis]|uniref:Uncharacterized protein n=1 Tax=Protopolystoma xenopodis TaxID=117903 RepID=A0A3S5ADH8_9PLAT|nr:unnamed protein product [Protopolystoma xenopodis]
MQSGQCTFTQPPDTQLIRTRCPNRSRHLPICPTSAHLLSSPTFRPVLGLFRPRSLTCLPTSLTASVLQAGRQQHFIWTGRLMLSWDLLSEWIESSRAKDGVTGWHSDGTLEAQSATRPSGQRATLIEVKRSDFRVSRCFRERSPFRQGDGEQYPADCIFHEVLREEGQVPKRAAKRRLVSVSQARQATIAYSASFFVGKHTTEPWPRRQVEQEQLPHTVYQLAADYPPFVWSVLASRLATNGLAHLPWSIPSSGGQVQLQWRHRQGNGKAHRKTHTHTYTHTYIELSYFDVLVDFVRIADMYTQLSRLNNECPGDMSKWDTRYDQKHINGIPVSRAQNNKS